MLDNAINEEMYTVSHARVTHTKSQRDNKHDDKERVIIKFYCFSYPCQCLSVLLLGAIVQGRFCDDYDWSCFTR